MNNGSNSMWRSLEERRGEELPAVDLNPAIRNEFLEAKPDSGGASRRSFLQLAGFSLAAAAGSACSRGPAKKAIPYLVPPEQIIPGRSYWMATTCGGCSAGCGMLSKGRDGRPVKLEGNPAHPFSRGGLCAVGQASLLELYDSQRLDGPVLNGAASDWQAADDAIRAKLAELKQSGGKVRVLTHTLLSPSTREQLRRFLAEFRDARHVEYDSLSASAILEAHGRTHGVSVLPRYSFEKARVIASFDADFLGTWISPVEFAAAYRAGRELDEGTPHMSRHVQMESRFSMTGSVADRRVSLAPAEIESQIAGLCRALAHHKGEKCPHADAVSGAVLRPEVEELAGELWSHAGESLVVCGSSDPSAQAWANYANQLLSNYGKTLDIQRPSYQRRGNDPDLSALLEELKAGSVDFLLMAGVNPAYELPQAAEFMQAVEQTGMVVCSTGMADETSALAQITLPAPHYLETWDDAEPIHDLFQLRQPAVQPLRNARTLRAGLAAWMGDETSDRDRIRDYWHREIFPRQSGASNFDRFFAETQERGFVDLGVETSGSTPAFSKSALSAPAISAGPDSGLKLVLYPKVGMLDGSHAHNPWLQELPDPVSKTVWDNYACLSPRTAASLGLELGAGVRVRDTESRQEMELPCLVQPGQHDGIVAVALGYGRAGTDRFSKVGPQWLQSELTVEAGSVVGRNAAPFLNWKAKQLRYGGQTVEVQASGLKHELACTQDHHRLEVPEHLAPAGGGTRDVVRTATLAEMLSHPGQVVHHGAGGHGEQQSDLWQEDHGREGHHWGMAVDLSACTGCSACVIACQAENNVPVVGKDEVRRHREMHWIRIDRYYQGEEDEVRSWHQPMMCQHCDHSPCETVCPVLATVHSSEGLNQQIYNRCVGTRYCANNCPYKVRRFNWFDYPREDRLQNMSLNPDVAIRSRGVMEKCSLCVQRILDAKIVARSKGEPLADGDIRTACQQSCPTQAITFGDASDPESRVSKLNGGPRAYGALEELNVRPSVKYLAGIVNAEPDGEGGGHG